MLASRRRRGDQSEVGVVGEEQEGREQLRDRKRADSKKADKSGGILGGLFGTKSDTAQGRSPTTTPRSSARDAKSGKPMARCKDGTTSYSAHHSGTCSNHGGVAEWLDK